MLPIPKRSLSEGGVSSRDLEPVLRRYTHADRSRSSAKSSSRKSSIAGSSKEVNIDENAHDSAELKEALEYIETSTEPGKLFLLVAQQWNQKKGGSINFVKLANELKKNSQAMHFDKLGERDGAFAPTAPPPEHSSTIASSSDESDYSDDDMDSLKRDFPQLYPGHVAYQKNLREALLDIELDDKPFQRRLISAPKKFRKGSSSIRSTDNQRCEKVKMYLQTSFGNRKFNGKKNSEFGILELLAEFNNAQAALNLTELEFVNFLTKATTGEPRANMINFFENNKRKEMSVDDIYQSLTDLYFHDLRPSAAEDKIKSFTENNHPFWSLTEAHAELFKLAYLSSLSLRSTRKQRTVAAANYRKAIMNILPREFIPMAHSNLEKIAKLRGSDLAIHEVLSALNRLREPIDDAFRLRQETSSKGRKNNDAKERRVTMVSAATTEVTNPVVAAASGSQGTPTSIYDFPPPALTKKRQKAKAIAKVAAAATASSNATAHASGCLLCGNPGHPSQKCPLFPGEKNVVGSGPCRHCNTGLRHMHRFCPARNEDTK